MFSSQSEGHFKSVALINHESLVSVRLWLFCRSSAVQAAFTSCQPPRSISSNSFSDEGFRNCILKYLPYRYIVTLCVLATVCIWKTLKTAPTVNIYFDFAIRDCSMHINAYVETLLPRTHKVTLLPTARVLRM